MHPPTSASAMRTARVPDAPVWAVVTVRVLPFFLSLAGGDFSTQVRVFNVESGRTPQDGIKALHQMLNGIATCEGAYASLCL